MRICLNSRDPIDSRGRPASIATKSWMKVWGPVICKTSDRRQRSSLKTVRFRMLRMVRRRGRSKLMAAIMLMRGPERSRIVKHQYR